MMDLTKRFSKMMLGSRPKEDDDRSKSLDWRQQQQQQQQQQLLAKYLHALSTGSEEQRQYLAQYNQTMVEGDHQQRLVAYQQMMSAAITNEMRLLPRVCC